MQASPTFPPDSPTGAPTRRPECDRTPRPDPLAREVMAVLAVKLIALLLLWLAFFRPGDAPQPASSAQAVARHVAAPLPEVPDAAR